MAALAGSLQVTTQGTVERPLLHADRDRAFERLDRKSVTGEGWFRVSSLTGVPRFVFVAPDADVRLDPTAVTVEGGGGVQLQLEAQNLADALDPGDLRQAKRAIATLRSTITKQGRGLPADQIELAVDLGLGRLAFVFAQHQSVEIRKSPTWLADTHALFGWSAAASELPTFYGFGTVVAAELPLAGDPVAVVDAVLAATDTVPGRDALVFTALDRGVTCCSVSRTASIALGEALDHWRAVGAPATQVEHLQQRLQVASALRVGQGLPGFSAIHHDDRSVDQRVLGGRRTVLQLWRTGQALGSMHTTVERFPDVQFVTLAQQPDDGIGPWRAALRELNWGSATHLFTPEGAQVFDRFYVDQGPAWLVVGPDGRLQSEVLTDPDAVRALLDQP